MKQHNINGVLCFSQFIGRDGWEWVAWNDAGDPHVANGATESQAVEALRAELFYAPAQSNHEFETFSRQRENVWRPRKNGGE